MANKGLLPHYLLFSSLILLLPPPGLAADPAEEAITRAVRQGARFRSNQLIVQYRNMADAATQAEQSAFAPLKKARLKYLKRRTQRDDGKGDLVLAQLPASADTVSGMAAAITQIRQNPAVEYAEPNWVLHHLPENKPRPPFPNDEFYRSGDTWGLYGDLTQPANPYGSQAGEVWQVHKHKLNCGDVYVGIIDEGIMTNHPELSASIWRNRFDPVDGIDNDRNGFIDDVNGWDFYHNDNSINDGPVEFHGTHVAGIISAAGDNGTGIAGVCWKAKLISAKFMDFDGGDTVNAIKAIDYITDLKRRHKLNIVATNNSWGGGGFSQAMIDAIKRAEKADILFIAAAGNDGSDNDVNPLYPASYSNSNIISVTALNQSGQISAFSNVGKKTVDIAAPGEEILSTIPWFDGEATYGFDTGSSMAAPFVTGAAALYAHYHPRSKAQRIKKALLNSAEPTADFANNTVSGGRLNIPAILRALQD